MLTFKTNYFILTVALFIIECLIAIYAHDKIIRPFIGDLLVAILLYCLVKSFFCATTKAVAIGVLMFSYAVETLQYFHILDVLGLSQVRCASIIIGTSFAWMDLLMYSLGIIITLILEYLWNRIKATKSSSIKNYLTT